ncbi:hypothetical protein ABI59_21805 [Acidobacteria bacterium Mor1]|nr:hypothetical protein ABI59_21805 [Acidobacteria bacterium Mor1]
MKPLVDHEAREAIRHDLDSNLLVEAAAGTGKTTELTRRIVAVLSAGRAGVDQIVAVTFTEKAAGELKLRIRAELEKARHAVDDPAERGRLDTALSRLEEARVNTIHGFCAELLRERSVDAGVDPEFGVMPQGEADRVFDEAYDGWLQEKLADPPEGLKRALRRPADDGPAERVRQAARLLVEWRDFPTPWRRDVYPREQAVDTMVERLHELADLTARCDNKQYDFLYRDTGTLRRVSDAIRTAEAVADRDYDWLEGMVPSALERGYRRNPRKGRGKSYGKGVAREEVLAAHRRFAEELDRFVEASDADLVALLQPELAEVVERYQALKARRGKLDFVDLLLRTRDLVRDSRRVREDFQERFTRVFIDEFQDTDPLQAEILLLLAAQDPDVDDWRTVDPQPGKLFLVGDPKQSIYRFRRADVGTYFEVKEQLEKCGAKVLQLSTSFRSVPGIQHAVNAAFEQVMTGDRETLQADYVPLSPFREEPSDRPSVVVLPVPDPYGRTGVAKYKVEGSLPDAVGAYVKWLIEESGWRVSTREAPDEGVPIAPQHICLLFRRFDSAWAGSITRPYTQALEARGVPHLLVGGRTFHEREEVATLRVALSAIEWPDDELSVYATLRGSLLAIPDELLFEFKQRHGRLHPLRAGRTDREELPERLTPIVDALELLSDLHRKRNRRTVAETIHVLLQETRAHAGFALRPAGEQVLANVLHVADQARDYETTGGISFRGFVERLLEEEDKAQAAEAPILEEGSEGVRLMTVHKSKGLEFPVVILADPTANLSFGRATRVIDNATRTCAQRLAGWAPVELLEHEQDEVGRDRAEGVRLAYVAATRARDLLVLPGIGTGPLEDSWLGPMDGGIYPEPAAWRDAKPATGCPEFEGPTVAYAPEGSGIAPGEHDLGSHRVVWWEAARLDLGVAPSYGVRRMHLLKESDDEGIDADRRRYLEWQQGRQDARRSGEVPSAQPRTATELAADEERRLPKAPPVELITLEIEPDRPGGKRFGALVHAALALVPLGGKKDRVERTVKLQARILGADAAEVAAATRSVERVLDHELLAAARDADKRGECRRETPLTLELEDGTLMEGIVDMAFRDAEGWVVLDFKTDRELGESRTVYERQVGLYAAAIAAATGEPCRGVLLQA